MILGLNLLMLAATPIDGSHYFIDVFAGIAIAAPCLLAARAIAAAAQRIPAVLPAGGVPGLLTGK